MRNLLLGFLLTSILFGFGCTANQSTSDTASEEVETPTEETTTEKQEEPMATPAPVDLANGSYQTTVLKDGIASPLKEMKGKAGNADITITYGSPSVKGRELWGGLVPFGKVWRTGANEATSFETQQDVQVGGGSLPAGKYGFFTIPESDKWTIIFNKNYQQWGSGSYSEADDVLRVEVKPKEIGTTSETMEFIVEGDEVILQWGNLAVPMNISAG